MPILLHQDFIQDYAKDSKESERSDSAPPNSYLINVTGELMEKEIKQRLAVKERIKILNELKNVTLEEFEREKTGFNIDEHRTPLCVDEELPLKNCIIDFKNIASEKQFDHLISCYHHLDAYEACLRNS